VLRETSSIVDYGLRVANVFHAGDGNMHPLILYNVNDPAEARRRKPAGMDVLRLCVDAGGCLTGEHGVGIEKRDLMLHQFTETDLNQQMRVRAAFDPAWLLNPSKVFPLDLEMRGNQSKRAGHDRNDTIAPASEEEAAEIVRQAAGRGTALEIAGGGTKRGIGQPFEPKDAVGGGPFRHHAIQSR
jgi:FAD/FMN-containing dehydrogenase